MTVRVLVVIAISATACIDPLVSDQVARPELILPKGSTPSDLADRPVARAAIERADGLPDGEEVIALRSGYAHGELIHYWDFGPASPQPIPLYLLVQADEAGYFQTPQGNFNPVVEHPPIFDAVPGDPGYSPWWTLVLWPVTSDYHGEVLASFEAVEEAFRQGLVTSSLTLPMALNCPVVLPEMQLQREAGSDATKLPTRAFYKQYSVYYFGISAIPITGPSVPYGRVYEVRREGGEPISEPIRGVDLTRDGDRLDTNDLFSAATLDPTYSGMVERVDAVVSVEDLIDSNDGETTLDDVAQLFRGEEPDPTSVIALYPTGQIVNRPLWVPLP